ncbi:MAG: MFS transporter, partial [Gammaproteobacteria bacterium]|nr:MFS transporter [Gammaproteobacteria bacterium]
MRETFKSVRALLLSYWLLMLATGLFSTLIAVRTDIESFSVFVTGLVMSSYFFGLLLGALFSAHLVIRVGHVRAFAVYASLMSTASIVHVLVITPPVWMGVRIMTGFCMAGMVLITEARLNERADNKVRGQLLALYMAIGYAGSGLGQFILPLADPAHFTLFGLGLGDLLARPGAGARDPRAESAAGVAGADLAARGLPHFPGSHHRHRR